MTYPVLLISDEQVLTDEQLGSKDKFWFERDSEEWLFKETRIIQAPSGAVVTGEDWAEKVSAEIATLLGISAARVELAEYHGKRGSASLNFVPGPDVHLEHGNEIMAGQVFGYNPHKKQKQSDHTLDNIILAIQHMFPKWASHAVLQSLAGYLMLDALICNTDRHHENWGLFWQTKQIRLATEEQEEERTVKLYQVAPSFDHASSLGRELLDERRQQLLLQDTVERYVRKGRGGIYQNVEDKHGANPLGLVEFAADRYPAYFKPALERLAAVPLDALQATLDHVPEDRMSTVGNAFAKSLLQITYLALCRLLT